MPGPSWVSTHSDSPLPIFPKPTHCKNTITINPLSFHINGFTFHISWFGVQYGLMKHLFPLSLHTMAVSFGFIRLQFIFPIIDVFFSPFIPNISSATFCPKFVDDSRVPRLFPTFPTTRRDLCSTCWRHGGWHCPTWSGPEAWYEMSGWGWGKLSLGITMRHFAVHVYCICILYMCIYMYMYIYIYIAT